MVGMRKQNLVLFGLAILLVSGLVLLSGCVEEETPTKKIFTGDVDSLLPSRTEIDTEFKIKEENFTIESYFSDYQELGLNTNGFQEGTTIYLEIFEGTSYTIGYIDILKFDSVDNAKSFYNQVVYSTKEERGYKEKNTSGINANCFALEGGNIYRGYYRNVYCQKKNIYFTTEIGTFKLTRLDSYKDWAKAITEKI